MNKAVSISNNSTTALWVDSSILKLVPKTSYLKENCFFLYFLPRKWYSTVLWMVANLVMKVSEFKLYYSRDMLLTFCSRVMKLDFRVSIKV